MRCAYRLFRWRCAKWHAINSRLTCVACEYVLSLMILACARVLKSALDMHQFCQPSSATVCVCRRRRRSVVSIFQFIYLVIVGTSKPFQCIVDHPLDLCFIVSYVNLVTQCATYSLKTEQVCTVASSTNSSLVFFCFSLSFVLSSIRTWTSSRVFAESQHLSSDSLMYACGSSLNYCRSQNVGKWYS